MATGAAKLELNEHVKCVVCRGLALPPHPSPCGHQLFCRKCATVGERCEEEVEHHRECSNCGIHFTLPLEYDDMLEIAILDDVQEAMMKVVKATLSIGGRLKLPEEELQQLIEESLLAGIHDPKDMMKAVLRRQKAWLSAPTGVAPSTTPPSPRQSMPTTTAARLVVSTANTVSPPAPIHADPPQTAAAAGAAAAAGESAAAESALRPPTQRPPEQRSQHMECVLLVWDFDGTQDWTGDDLHRFYTSLVARLRTEGFLKAGELEAIAFGVLQSMSHVGKTKMLQDLNVSMRVVSNLKKEETDRQLESFVRDELRRNSDAYKSVVLISSDKGFVPLMQFVLNQGKQMIVVHNASPESEHERTLMMYASKAFRISSIARIRACGVAPVQSIESYPLEPPTASEVTQDELCGVVRNVRLDKRGLQFAIVHPDNGQGGVFVHCRNMSGGELRDGQRIKFKRVENPAKPGMLMAINAKPCHFMTVDADAVPSNVEETVEDSSRCQRGEVLSWKTDKSGSFFGFIKPVTSSSSSSNADVPENIFFHETDNPHLLQVVEITRGAIVEFVAIANPLKSGQMKAIDVKVLEVPRKALVSEPTEVGRSQTSTGEIVDNMKVYPTEMANLHTAPVKPRHIGTLTRVSRDKHGQFNGFLSDDRAGDSVYFHESDNSLAIDDPGFKLGARVSFSRLPNPFKVDQDKAENIIVLCKGRIFNYGREKKYGFLTPENALGTNDRSRNVYFHIADSPKFDLMLKEALDFSVLRLWFFRVKNLDRARDCSKAIIVHISQD